MLLGEIVQAFLEETPRILDQIRSALQASDSNQLQRAAHTVKGSLRTLGAEAAAEKLQGGESEKIRQAYLMFFGRPPTEKELATASKFIKEYPPSTKPPRSRKEPWIALCQAMFGSAEFLMRN